MAGLGRRSHYRKHLTDAVLHEYPIPEEDDNECIGQVVGTRGGNQFDVIVAARNGSDGNSDSDHRQHHVPQLAILPNKFHKLIWVKRGDYVIVKTVDSDDDDDDNDEGGAAALSSGGSGIRYLITHILYKDQIKYLQQQNLWPTEFQTAAATTTGEAAQDSQQDAQKQHQQVEDGIVYYQDTEVMDNSDDLMSMVNTNRIRTMQIQDSSSDSEESSDDDDDDDILQEQAKDDNDDGIVYDTGDDDLFVSTNRVTALRIQESEDEDSSSSSNSDSKDSTTVHKNHKHAPPIKRQTTDDDDDDGLVFDTANREAGLPFQGSLSAESSRDDDQEEKEDVRVQEEEDEIQPNDSIEYDTGNIHKQKRTTLSYEQQSTTTSVDDDDEKDVALSADVQDSDDDDESTEGVIGLAETGDSGIEYDTGKGTDICQTRTNDSSGVEYDTGIILQDDEEDGRLLAYGTSRDEDDDDDEEVPNEFAGNTQDDDIRTARTNDSVEYDTGNILLDEEEGLPYYETSKDDDDDDVSQDDLVYDTQRGAEGFVASPDRAIESDSGDDETEKAIV